MLGCSLGWWVAMDRGGAGTISQLFRTLTVDLFSHNPPISHYSLLTPLTPPLLLSLSLSFFLALSHTTSLSAPPPIGNVTQRGTWQKASNTLTEEDEHEENACLHKSRRAGCCIHTHTHTHTVEETDFTSAYTIRCAHAQLNAQSQESYKVKNSKWKKRLFNRMIYCWSL